MTTFDWEDRERDKAEPAATEPGPLAAEPDLPMPSPVMPETPGTTESGAETVMQTPGFFVRNPAIAAA